MEKLGSGWFHEEGNEIIANNYLSTLRAVSDFAAYFAGKWFMYHLRAGEVVRLIGYTFDSRGPSFIVERDCGWSTSLIGFGPNKGGTPAYQNAILLVSGPIKGCWFVSPVFLSWLSRENYDETVKTPSYKNHEFPHECPKCNAPAYIGFTSMQCSRSGCDPQHKPLNKGG